MISFFFNVVLQDDPTGDAYLSPVDTAPATAWPRSASQKLPKKTIMVCGTVAIATLITGVAIVITGVAAGLPAHQMRPMPNGELDHCSRHLI